jgi:hypothetical protein
MVTCIIFQNHLLEANLTQNWETTSLRTLTTVDLFYFYHVWRHTWIDIHWNNIWLRYRSHMTSHYTWGSLTTLHDFGAMIGKNRRLVTDEPVEVQECRRITDHFRGSYRIYPKLIKENRRMSTCNRLDLETLGSQPIGSKNLPNHCFKFGGVFGDGLWTLSFNLRSHNFTVTALWLMCEVKWTYVLFNSFHIRFALHLALINPPGQG